MCLDYSLLSSSQTQRPYLSSLPFEEGMIRNPGSFSKKSLAAEYDLPLLITFFVPKLATKIHEQSSIYVMKWG